MTPPTIIEGKDCERCNGKGILKLQNNSIDCYICNGTGKCKKIAKEHFGVERE